MGLDAMPLSVDVDLDVNLNVVATLDVVVDRGSHQIARTAFASIDPRSSPPRNFAAEAAGHRRSWRRLKMT